MHQLPRWAVLVGVTLGLSGGILAQQSSPRPLVELLFAEDGTVANSTGTVAVEAMLLDTNGGPTDLHTQGGRGVSGLPTDRAFTNFGSNQMGSTTTSPGEGGVVLVKNSGLPGLRSFTLQGWYFSTSFPGNFARLFDSGSVSVYFDTGLTLQLGTNSVTAEHKLTQDVYRRAKSWHFFAIGYDGVAATDNVKFYAGSPEEQVKLVATLTLRGPYTININDFTVGNRAERARPFRGSMDDFRIWGEALAQSQLEAVRKSDSLTGHSIK